MRLFFYNLAAAQTQRYDWVKVRPYVTPEPTNGLGAIEYYRTADLALSKSGLPDPAALNGDLRYTLVVTNNGPDTASGVTLTDVLPAGVTFMSATPSQGSCSGTTTVTCSLGAILSGLTATGSLSNTASVAGNEYDPVPANNAATALTTVFVASAVDVP